MIDGEKMNPSTEKKKIEIGQIEIKNGSSILLRELETNYKKTREWGHISNI